MDANNKNNTDVHLLPVEGPVPVFDRADAFFIDEEIKKGFDLGFLNSCCRVANFAIYWNQNVLCGGR